MADLLETLIEDHYHAAYCFAFSLAGNHDDACDLTQQAFFLAQTKAHQLRDPSKHKSWLFTILHREFLKARRHQMRHPTTELDEAAANSQSITVDHAAALDAQTVVAVLGTLEEHYRLPLALFYFDQLSYREIAGVLEIPIGTVMSRLARGRGELRERLEAARRRADDVIVSMTGTETRQSNG